MKITINRILIAIATLSTVGVLYAQNGDKPPYMNPALPAQQRAEDLVHRMSVEEKVTQLVNQSRAIPRLNVRFTAWRW
jgi:beta-glucosidase